MKIFIVLCLIIAYGCSITQESDINETQSSDNSSLGTLDPNQPSATVPADTKALSTNASDSAAPSPTSENLLPDSAAPSPTSEDLIPDSLTGLLGFTRKYVDTNYGGNGKPGWVRAGDMDSDGDIDIVVGGGRAIFIYENDGNAKGWQRLGNLDSTNQIGANGGALYDVDSDGDIDVVSAKYYSDLGWWENPGGSLSNTPWGFHKLGDTSWYLHDIIIADLDQDGVAEEFVANLNEAYWNTPAEIKWFRPGTDPKQLWEAHMIDARNPGDSHGHAGLDVGDVDKDGHLDLAFSYGWYEAPDDPTDTWVWHPITDIYGISNTLIRDLNGDQAPDLVMSAGHHGQGVYWFENTGDPKDNSSWIKHNISKVTSESDIYQRHFYSASDPEHLHHPECLGVLDLDGEKDQDVVTCDLFFGEDPGEPGWDEEVHNVYVYENTGTASNPSWNKQNVAPSSFPSHLLQMVDINEDGQMDFISEGAGYQIVSYYENMNASGLVPTINYSPSTVVVGETISFTDTSTSDNFPIITWQWDFGDGSPKASAQNVQHAYDRPDVFKVKLVITDQEGVSDSAERTIVVLPNAAWNPRYLAVLSRLLAYLLTSFS